MRPPEEIRADFVNQWLHKAAEDLNACKALLSANPPVIPPACFHAQQAAEKYLKAFLTSRALEFPKAHDLQQLVDLVGSIEPALAGQLSEAASLSPYGVEIRYPGEAPEPDAKEAEKALDIAKAVRDTIVKRLSPTG